jgi:hypothetical protein
MNNAIIYDYETLSSNPQDGVVLSLAALAFDETRYVSKPYTYEELLGAAQYIKFNVEEQVRVYGRKIQKETVEWWSIQDKAAQHCLAPSADDRSISELPTFLRNLATDPKSIKRVYTRGNTFDPIFTESILKVLRQLDPYHWGTVRDTRSMIEGLSWGTNLDNGFMVDGLKDKFVKHDPIHDIAMDVMRMQVLVQAIS